MGIVEFRYGELFCGAGGLALGAVTATVGKNDEKYSIAHSWATDYDVDSCETYRSNICPECPDSVLCIDIRSLDFGRLPPIDGLAFGFPCNDFSLVGETKGFDGEFGPLYVYAIKAIEHFRPIWFIAENVGGMRSANEGQAFSKILTDLHCSGYNLTVNLYKFEDYGVPQARHRIIIVGFRSDTELLFEVPSPSYKHISAKEALENPPMLASTPNNEYTNQSQTVIERLKHIKPGENAWNANIPEHLRMNVKSARMSHIYRRLHPDFPAYTITASGGGGTHTYHWDEDRALTNRERARLQTFPDNYVFRGAKESVRKQIGMAVPATGAKKVFEAILKTCVGLRYDSVNPSIGYYTVYGGQSSSVPSEAFNVHR